MIETTIIIIFWVHFKFANISRYELGVIDLNESAEKNQKLAKFVKFVDLWYVALFINFAEHYRNLMC